MLQISLEYLVPWPRSQLHCCLATKVKLEFYIIVSLYGGNFPRPLPPKPFPFNATLSLFLSFLFSYCPLVVPYTKCTPIKILISENGIHRFRVGLGLAYSCEDASLMWGERIENIWMLSQLLRDLFHLMQLDLASLQGSECEAHSDFYRL